MIRKTRHTTIPACSRIFFRLSCKRGAKAKRRQPQAGEHRHQHDQREFCDQGQPARYPEHHRASPGSRFQIISQHDKKKKEGECGGKIGMYDPPVSEHGRLQRVERDGQHTGARPEEIACVGENNDAETKRDDDHHCSGPKAYRLKLFFVALPEAVVVAERQLYEPALHLCFCRRRLVRLNKKKRQRGPHLNQRRVFVVQFKIARDQMVVPGRNVNDFVGGDGFARNNCKQLEAHYRE